MPKSVSSEQNKTARLEARIPVGIYEMMQRAAHLRGMTMTGYLLATAGAEAQRVVEETAILRLNLEDQARIAAALMNPPPVQPRLTKAAEHHAALIAPDESTP